MLTTILVISVIMYFLCMIMITTYYTKEEMTFINERNVAWMVFVVMSLVLIFMTPEITRNQFDKQVKIGDDVTVKQLFDQGYIVVNKVDGNTYKVRELTPHQQPLEEIKSR